MDGVAILIVAAISLRAAAAVLYCGERWPSARVLGWLVAAFAAWLGAGAAGAWFPLWPCLLVGAAGALAAAWLNLRQARALVDVVVVFMSGLLSMPQIEPARLVIAAAVLAAVGVAAEAIYRRVGQLWRRLGGIAAGFAGATVVGFVALSVLQPGAQRPAPRAWELLSAHAAVAAARIPGTSRVELPRGVVAWLNQPSGDGPFPVVLFFHGNHPSGSHQPAALIARRALLEAGFAVLAVDHPGYGDSAAPVPLGDLAAWDPLPGARAALAFLEQQGEASSVLAVGHSLGTQEVMRTMAASDEVAAAVLFGGSRTDAHRPPDHPKRYKQFLRVRSIALEHLPRATVDEIQARFYDKGALARALPPSHVPVLFVDFGIEWDDVQARRDELYALIPGAKRRHSLDASTHYFNAAAARGILVGDTRVTGEVVRLLREFYAALPEAETRREPAVRTTTGPAGGE